MKPALLHWKEKLMRDHDKRLGRLEASRGQVMQMMTPGDIAALDALARRKAEARGGFHIILWGDGLTWADALARYEREIQSGDHVESVYIEAAGVDDPHRETEQAIAGDWMRARQ